MRDGTTHLADSGETGVQVVLREERLVLGDLLHRMVGAHRTRTTALAELGRPSGAIGEQHPPVPRVLRIRGRIEQVGSRKGCEGEHERMARPDEMVGLRWVPALL